MQYQKVIKIGAGSWILRIDIMEYRKLFPKEEKIAEKEMKERCGRLFDKKASNADLFNCPMCGLEKMEHLGWQNKWVDYMCPSCTFRISFQAVFD